MTKYSKRHIHEVLYDLDFCFPYLDNNLITSKSQAEHELHLQPVLSRFDKYDLTINPSKCVLKVDEIKFLGQLVSEHGCKLLSSKVKGIVYFPQTQKGKQLRRFLGTLNYYRLFLPDTEFTQMPLNDHKNDKRQIL